MNERKRLAGEVFAQVGDDRALQRACAAGHLHRVRRGVYVDAAEWKSLDARWRCIVRVTAFMRTTGGRLVVSHESAAALWGFPEVDGWPSDVHVIDPGRSTTKRSTGLVRHPARSRLERTVRWGVPTAAALDTAIDVARDGGFVRAVVAFDHGLRRRLFTRERLDDAVERMRSVRGVRHLRRAAELASEGSDSAGESLSKLAIHQLGFPPAQQQKRFPNPRGGKDYRVDFWWEGFGLIGEFDGKQKYLDEAMRSGRTIEEVILDEKRREDDLRALPEVRNLVRWQFADAVNPPILRRILVAAGLPEPRETPSTRRIRGVGP